VGGQTPSSKASISASLAPPGRHLTTRARILLSMETLDWYRTHVKMTSPRRTKTLVSAESKEVSTSAAASTSCAEASSSPSSSAMSYEKTEGGGLAILPLSEARVI